MARIFATAFIELYLVGVLQLAVMRRPLGAQPTVVQAATPYPYGPHFGAPLRTIYRLRVEPALWSLAMIALIAIAVARSPMAADLSARSPSHIPVARMARTTLEQVVTSGAEALSCAVVVGIDAATAETSCKAGLHE